MKPGIFTALALATLVLAAVCAAFSLSLSLIMIGSVLVASIGLLIYRVKFQ